MYDKFSCLRIEMTVNDPREFKIYKEVHHRDGITSKRWVPMGKSISNLYRYAEISKAANRRFLDAMCNVIPHSRRYLVSDKGRRVMGSLIETKRRTYPALASG